MKKQLILLINVLLNYATFYADNTNDLILHYNKPAEYFEEALVIGNGTLGGIIYGGTTKDIISLNDLTLWTGEPDKKMTQPEAYKAIPQIRKYLEQENYKAADIEQKKVQGHYSENYQPLGKLTITYLDSLQNITSYNRSLNISTATARTEYIKNNKNLTCDYFASSPDSVIVIRIKSNDINGINAIISFDSQLPHSTKANNTEICSEGYAAYHSYPIYYKQIKNKHLYDPDRGVHFNTIIRVITKDGETKSYPSGELKIQNSHEAVILVTNVTSFNGFDKDPVTEGKNYKELAKERIDKASTKKYEELLKYHINDYKNYFDRVKLYLGRTSSEISQKPTDEQLRLYTDKKQYNPELEVLYFQYGRYLLISCSRTPEVPANLQGLWNEELLPPWSSNYTTNINLEENYWAAESTNLSEMHKPLLDFIKNLSKTGKESAKHYYGIDNGWCLGQNSDIWAMTCPVGLNVGSPSWACWTMGGAWLSTHIWEHYTYTMDKNFLREYYPILKGAAEFCLDWLIEKDGKLMTSPGTSPENRFITPDGYAGATSYGCTSDLAITRECIIDAKKAAETLKTDPKLIQRIDETIKRLSPYKIGKEGNLQEWYHDWKDADRYHRHQSHLIGLYPGHHISPEKTPDLAKACDKTLEMRGNKTTGWSTGWRINLYARLKDGNKAYNTYRQLLKYISPDKYEGKDAIRGGGTYPNLLDAHSPFQIDGNFGGCAGVVEMLLHSTEKTITLLPAIPDEWKNGEVRGICARGGFVIDMKWQNGIIRTLNIYSRNGGKTEIKYNGKSKKIRLGKDEIIKIL